MMNRITFIITICSFLAFPEIQSQLQAQTQTNTVNTYVQFVNESIHGMLIVHRMLENFNQEVNKYVDLQSDQINFYGNKDLPANIFLDEDHYFYDRTPYELYHECLTIKSALPKELIEKLPKQIRHLKGLIDRINGLRFSLDSVLQNEDMTQTENQKKIYVLLENGVTYYDEVFAIRKQFNSEVMGWALAQKLVFDQNRTYRIHHLIATILEAIRNKDKSNIHKWLKELDSVVEKPAIGNQSIEGKIFNLVKEFSTSTQDYLNGKSIPDFYRLYGSYYYYYNVELINKFNRYGNGLVQYINKMIDGNPDGKFVYFLELPHFYRVIYPENNTINPFQGGKDTLIVDKPDRLKDRELVGDKIIEVDDYYLTLELFDHKDQDGDIISLNYNGEWVLENKALKKKPFELKLRLNREGRNYLILHAENVGSRPPNTVAIHYEFRGKQRQIILNSNMKESEVIEIEKIE